MGNDTTLQDDDHLSLAIGAGEAWEFEAFILCTGASSTPDIRFAFRAPEGATLHWVSEFQEGTAIVHNALVTVSGTSVTNAITAGSTDVIRVRGIVTNAATPGVLQFQWSQNSPDDAPTRVLPNSFLMASRFEGVDAQGQAGLDLPDGPVSEVPAQPAPAPVHTADAGGFQ